MAESSTLARPYAKAAFDYAHANHVVKQWEDFLFIATTLVNDEDYKTFLNNPSISGEQKLSVLTDIFDEQVATDKETSLKTLLQSASHHQDNQDVAQVANSAYRPDSVSGALKGFLQQLAANNRLLLIPSIYEQYRLLRAKSFKQIEAEITTAYPLNAAQKTLIKTRLEESLNAQIVLNEVVDKALIAGARIKVGDKVVDDSVAGKLKQLKAQLTSA